MTDLRVAAPETVPLSAGALEASFAPHAGMAGVSLRHDGEELLSTEQGLPAYLERGAVMGIPLLHPWANRLDVDLPGPLPRDEHGLPIHGVLPRPWEVIDAGDAHLVAALDFDDPVFPFPHRLEQRVTLTGAALRVETALHAGRGAVPVSFGFHPYLRLPGVPREEWIVSLPARRRLLADDRGIPTGPTVTERAEVLPLGARFFDDGYDELGALPRFGVSGGGRAISVRFLAGYPVAQVFAPRDHDVICFEPMTAPTNALVSGRGLRVAAPGSTFVAAFEIVVRS